MNFCCAKKRTLQSFVMKKADTANFCSQKKRTLQSLGRGTLYNCVLDTTKLYNRYKFEREHNPNAIMCMCLHVDPKVTRITKSDTPSFFIPQPPPPQWPATMSPARNTHHHEHPWLPTDHDSHLTTKHDDHTPTSPASMTTSAPSTSAATSRNPQHKQTWPPKRRQPPNRQPHAKQTTNGG